RTSTLVSVLPVQHYSPVDYPLTNSRWKVITVNTPPSKRHHTQPHPGVSERNAVAVQAN
ncbi:unnamed protein product, partial [Rotaria magnacalcarata]